MAGQTTIARDALIEHLSPDIAQIVKAAVAYEVSRLSFNYDDMAEDICDMTGALDALMQDCEARVADAAATYADMAAE